MSESSDQHGTAQAHDARAAAAAENLRFAVHDHQEMIRGADYKAEVLGIFLTGVFAAVAWQDDISAKRALHTDWPSELTYELWKISRIGAAKLKWFRAALVVSGISVLAVTLQLLMP